MTVFSGRYSRHCFATVFMFVMCISLQGQNLVPNPSFEEYTVCPEGNGAIEDAVQWNSATAGTPDLYNYCSSGFGTSVPTNWAGYQEPHSGNGYAGFYNYNQFIELREYMQTNLETPLEAGVAYWVS